MLKRANCCVSSTSRSASNGHEQRIFAMAKLSATENNNRKRKLVKRFAAKRAALKAIIMNRGLSMEDRFKAQLAINELPRNSTKVRVRNRCGVTGRPRAYYRKLNMSRVALRELGNSGRIPGLVKSSW
jgi:small subunit ribosomal protein S14